MPIFDIVISDKDGVEQYFNVEAPNMHDMYRELWAKYGSKYHQLHTYRHKTKGAIVGRLLNNEHNPNFNWVSDLEAGNVIGVYITGPEDFEIYCDQMQVTTLEEFTKLTNPYETPMDTKES